MNSKTECILVIEGNEINLTCKATGELHRRIYMDDQETLVTFCREIGIIHETDNDDEAILAVIANAGSTYFV